MGLENIARIMRGHALREPYVRGKCTVTNYQQKLRGGLVLTLYVEDGRYMLALRRNGLGPSVAEQKICRAAFGVPEDAKVRPICQPADGEPIYTIVTYRWQTAESVEAWKQKKGVTHANPDHQPAAPKRSVRRASPAAA